VAHVEAGLRSFDRTMPEEINRIVTDSLASYLFTPSADGDANLIREGAPADRIFRVGNVMIDTLIRCLPIADATSVLDKVGLRSGDQYALVTLHRPANVDSASLLEETMAVLATIADRIPVVFPMHPRTRSRLPATLSEVPGLHLIDPVGYLEFVGLEARARMVITDSGGVQEETTYLGVPCLTVRDNTERPVTITGGTNRLVGTNPKKLLEAAVEELSRPRGRSAIPELWDGRAAERIADVFTDNTKNTKGTKN
jgi:UDP-N-acetylglucosamine 2-epimerase (non-hydrolysing)